MRPSMVKVNGPAHSKARKREIWSKRMELWLNGQHAERAACCSRSRLGHTMSGRETSGWQVASPPSPRSRAALQEAAGRCTTASVLRCANSQDFARSSVKRSMLSFWPHSIPEATMPSRSSTDS